MPRDPPASNLVQPSLAVLVVGGNSGVGDTDVTTPRSSETTPGERVR